jgi:hypothetical protein
MNMAHIHLILNHLPIFGTLFGLALLAVGLLRNSDELKRISLIIFVFMALAVVPVYLTGEPAESQVKNLPDVSGAFIETHEAAAQVSLATTMLLGMASCVALALSIRKVKAAVWMTPVVLGLALLVSGSLTYTASLGGQIRHSEIRGGAANPTGTTEGERGSTEQRESQEDDD